MNELPEALRPRGPRDAAGEWQRPNEKKLQLPSSIPVLGGEYPASRQNPFAALEETNKLLLALEEAVVDVVRHLTGRAESYLPEPPLPAEGLLGISAGLAHEMGARCKHLRKLLETVEAHLG